MSLTKMATMFILVLSLATSAFAGKEDWVGIFTIDHGLGSISQVRHGPSAVYYGLFITSICIHLKKGFRINDVSLKEDVNLCTDANVETFTNELNKLGVIVSQSVRLGPTYSN